MEEYPWRRPLLPPAQVNFDICPTCYFPFCYSPPISSNQDPRFQSRSTYSLWHRNPSLDDKRNYDNGVASTRNDHGDDVNPSGISVDNDLRLKLVRDHGGADSMSANEAHYYHQTGWQKVCPRCCKKRSVLSLPSEILVEILLKLPVKSLARARATCKLWRTIINDTDFIEKHLHDSAKNYIGWLYSHKADSANTYFVESSRKEILDDDGDKDQSIESIHIPEGRFPQLLKTTVHDLNPRIVGRSSGGLFASFIRNEKCFHVCNPITGEEIKITVHPLFLHNTNFDIYWWGFGYSPFTKEYKILLHVFTQEVPKAAIYTLGLGSNWRFLSDDFPFLFPSRHCGDCDGSLFLLRGPPFDQGPPYIASFDIGCERFRLWKGPNADMVVKEDDFEPYLITCGDTIAFVKMFDDHSMSIWVLRDKANEVWIKDCNIPSVPNSGFNTSNFRRWINNKDFFGYVGKGFWLIYDSKHRQFRKISLPFAEELDMFRGRYMHFYPLVGSLVSPKRIMDMPKV